jgi:RHS repeat-associated protein
MIVSVDPDGTTTTIPTTTFTYDALHRRISTDADGAGSGVATTHYYSKDWQVLEDRVGSIVKHAYVMSPVFVDAMVLRDSDTDNDNDTGDYGGVASNQFEQRIYVLNDANFNVTSIVGDTDSGTPRNFQVIERFRADAYGAPTFLDPNWAVDTGGSDFGWMHLHQGGRYDAATKLAHFRWRDLHVELGRWTRQDPLGFFDGLNVYELERSLPTTAVDPSGTARRDANFTGFVYYGPWQKVGPRPGSPMHPTGTGANGMTYQLYTTVMVWRRAYRRLWACVDDANGLCYKWGPVEMQEKTAESQPGEQDHATVVLQPNNLAGGNIYPKWPGHMTAPTTEEPLNPQPPPPPGYNPTESNVPVNPKLGTLYPGKIPSPTN